MLANNYSIRMVQRYLPASANGKVRGAAGNSDNFADSVTTTRLPNGRLAEINKAPF